MSSLYGIVKERKHLNCFYNPRGPLDWQMFATSAAARGQKRPATDSQHPTAAQTADDSRANQAEIERKVKRKEKRKRDWLGWKAMLGGGGWLTEVLFPQNRDNSGPKLEGKENLWVWISQIMHGSHCFCYKHCWLVWCKMTHTVRSIYRNCNRDDGMEKVKHFMLDMLEKKNCLVRILWMCVCVRVC